MAFPGARRRKRWLFIGAALLILFLAVSLAGFYTDVLWFQEVGITSVLWTTLGAQFILGVVVGLLVAVLVWANLVVAQSVAPPYRPPRLEVVGRVDPLEQYRELITPHLRWVRLGVAGALGTLTGLGASSGWQTLLLWVNRVSFGQRDPQFARDISFYVFDLPWFNLVLDYLWFAFLISLLLSIVAHFFYGSIRPEAGLSGVWPGALAHLSVLLGCLALVKAGQYWLGRFSLNFSVRGTVTGASYTDVNAHLPALSLLAIISVISAILFIVNIRFRRLSLPLGAVGLWIFFSVAAGALWPALVQRFSVEPQELQREREFIDRNIQATQRAFSLDDVETQRYPVSQELSAETVGNDAGFVENVRVWDPGILQQVYRQLQAIRTYYQFPDVDIDRYEIDGELRQVLLSARELSVTDLPEGSRSWANQHLFYTHGFGLVSSLANEQTSSGQPSFLVQDVPGTVAEGAEALEAEEPRVYYGESFESSEYSIVNSRQEELDFETAEDDQAQTSRYAGEGGVPVGGLLQRAAFALRERDPNLLLSNLITNDSKMLIYKNVRNRVQRAAPFLSLDHDPYIASIDGRLVWVLDAYTSTPYYPYSERFDLGQIVGSDAPGTLQGTANYVRNSVKIVVDAYDGTMDFYVVDKDDPLLEAWRGAFPALFTDDEPSPDLAAHFRYPEDLFKIQSEVYLTYHMDQPDAFYQKTDAWAVPENQRNLSGVSGDFDIPTIVPPTYLLTDIPGAEAEEEFILTRPFTPRARDNMIAFMVGRSDPEHYGELLTLEFPPQQIVRGPIQINSLINQKADLSEDLSLLDQRGSTVDYGSLVILPVDDSVLYVQPLFLRANSSSTTDLTTGSGGGIPELYQVIVIQGDDIVRGETFEDALNKLFGVATPPAAPTEPGGPGGGRQGSADEQLLQIIEEADALYNRAQSALQDGDLETYARLIERVGELLDEAGALRPPPNG